MISMQFAVGCRRITGPSRAGANGPAALLASALCPKRNTRPSKPVVQQLIAFIHQVHPGLCCQLLQQLIGGTVPRQGQLLGLQVQGVAVLRGQQQQATLLQRATAWWSGSKI